MIQAIETRYNGYRFRSRTEARWAVFFDTVGIIFDYEPLGVVLNGKPYLPDFWLPEAKLWMEVKGQEATSDEIGLCRQLAASSGFDCLLSVGPPRSSGGVFQYKASADNRHGVDDGELSFHFADDRRDSGVYWLLATDRCCFPIIGLDKASNHDRWPMVHDATARGYIAANSARFEHGESGPG